MLVSTVEMLAKRTGLPVADLRALLGEAGIAVHSDRQVIGRSEQRLLADFVARRCISITAQHGARAA